ncbi:MAG: hypothetical protein II453_09930 [Alphaproteobacteria bacterium]|nr:hypothetical protein [Alphaproteobacteria bacterium]MBQ3946361.1 hypothetical protein [Alphaproteobacteria bacterium]
MRFDIWQVKRECEENKHHFDKNGNLAVNVWLDFIDFKPVVAMFVGKALKPKYYYRFNNEMDAARFIKTHVEYELNNINDRIERREAEKERKKNFKTSLKVGDIMHGSWGYDMTINEFYQITEIKNKTVILRELGMERKAVGQYEDVRPEANCFIGEPIKRILQVRFYNGQPYEYIKLSDVCNLTKCEDTNRYYYENHWD